MARLYIFDLDGTLVEKFGERPMPGVIQTIAALQDQGADIAVATNQAGPAWRVATGESKYPDPRRLGARFLRIATRIPQVAEVPWFVAVGDDRLSLTSLAYKDLIRELEEGAIGLGLHVSAEPGWRKPEPGMLLAACERFHVPADLAVYVGDYRTDEEAARNAGTVYAGAEAFFDRQDADEA